MGAIADALSNAAGQVKQGVNSATGAASNAVGLGPSSSIPSTPTVPGGLPTGVNFNNVQLPPSAMSAMQAGNVSPPPGLSINDLLGSPQAAQQLAMNTNPAVNNPFGNLYMQSTPQAAAASIGTPDSSSQTNAPFTPTHKEGTAAKIGDFFFHDLFRNRTIAANERDAIESSMGPDGKIDPNAAAKKLYAIPGVDPMKVAQLLEGQGQTALQQGQGQFYSAYGDMRNDEAIKSAIGTVSAGFGPQSAIGMAIAKGEDPSSVYDKMRPLYDAFLQKAHVPDDVRAQMLPQKFDPDVANSVASMGVSGADQARIQLEGARTAQQQAYQNQEINLRASGLKLQQAELGVHAATAQSDILKNQSEIDKNAEGSLTQRQALYTKVLGPAAKIPWLYGNFVKGTFGGGSSGMPKPGTAYVSPDKTAAAEMTAQGQWKIYDITKGPNHAKLVGTIGGAVGATSGNGDFQQ